LQRLSRPRLSAPHGGSRIQQVILIANRKDQSGAAPEMLSGRRIQTLGYALERYR